MIFQVQEALTKLKIAFKRKELLFEVKSIRTKSPRQVMFSQVTSKSPVIGVGKQRYHKMIQNPIILSLRLEQIY